MSTNGRLDITLNQTGLATVTVQKSSLDGITRRWIRPWAHGILLTLESEALGETPVFAGPITAPPAEYPDSLSFSVSGIRAVFEHRFATAKDYGTDVAAMRKSKLVYKDRSLAYIAQDLVRRGMDKAGGYLPIRFATNPGSGSHERTYHGYDLENNRIDKRLEELSNVIGGPDILFHPEWADEARQYIRWAMYTGTDAHPPIAQDWSMVLDAGAPEPHISELAMEVDGDDFSTRFYATGTGEGEGIAMMGDDNRALLSDGHPLLEGTASFPSVSEARTLLAYARAGTDIRPWIELQAVVDIADRRSPYGRWIVGHSAVVKPGPWVTIPDAEVSRRILRIAGDLDTSHFMVYFQEDQW